MQGTCQRDLPERHGSLATLLALDTNYEAVKANTLALAGAAVARPAPILEA